MVGWVHRLRMGLASALLSVACEGPLKSDEPIENHVGQDSGARAIDEVMPSPNRSRYCWVGSVDQTDVRVALLVGTGKARLFFCGGAGSYATTTRWFDIAYDGSEHIDFTEQAWRIHAHLFGTRFTGKVVLGDGVERSLDADRTSAETLAGLYEGTAECGRLGLIVTQATPDAVPASQGACTSDSGAPIQQVDAVAPLAAEAGKIRVHLPSADDATLLLQAATVDP